MEIGEENEAFAKVPVLLLDGLLDLDDHLGETPDVMGRAYDLCARCLILVVGHGGECACLLLDENLMSGFDQGLDASWGYAYTALVILHFPGHTDNHSLSPNKQSCFRLYLFARPEDVNLKNRYVHREEFPNADRRD